MAQKRSLLGRLVRYLGLLLVVALIGLGVLVYRFLRTETVKLDDAAWAMLGGGGNTLILLGAGEEGPLVVDTKFLYPATALVNEVQRVAGRAPRMVINTHFHFDHTGGNPRFVGAEFAAQKRTREHLLQTDSKTFGPGGRGERSLPTTLIDDDKRFAFGDDFVEIAYLGNGHTDGDVIVFLHKRSLLHTGDLFFNGMYPVIDRDHGGSVRELGPTLDKIIALSPQRIIPGHGPIATVDDLKKYRAYVAALWDHALAGARAGKSLGEVKSSFDAAPYGLHPMTGITSLAQNLEIAYAEATDWVKAGH